MRVWLSQWEWACCGTPFAVGDRVTFNVAARHPSAELAADLGAELAGTIDTVESHHEEEFPERVSGVVTAVARVSLMVEEHTMLRRPGHGAPPDAVMPTEGQEWPQKITDLGGDVTMRSQPSRHITEVRRLPGTAALTPARGVRLPTPDAPDGAELADRPPADPAERRSWAGWLIDLEEKRSS